MAPTQKMQLRIKSMIHPLVQQLRFTRSEFTRCLEGVSAEEAVRRFEPMNCISWIIGHLAHQEQSYWVAGAQGQEITPDLAELVGYGQPSSTPPLNEMWDAWHKITETADQFLDTVTLETLSSILDWSGRKRKEDVGTLLLRNIYHYWFHLGEAHAIRQLLGHTDLPQFVGDMTQAQYRSA
jgi:uncharacterized damage-inducible protein DinB